jgi:hypothetical protein
MIGYCQLLSWISPRESKVFSKEKNIPPSKGPDRTGPRIIRQTPTKALIGK